jgi:hypothetical protein
MRKEQLQSLTINQERYSNRTLSGRNGESMRAQPPVGHQTNFFGTDLLLQLDAQDPLLKLSTVIPWSDFDQAATAWNLRKWMIAFLCLIYCRLNSKVRSVILNRPSTQAKLMILFQG